jgi:hypothetical protein
MKKISKILTACFFAVLTIFIALPAAAQSNQESGSRLISARQGSQVPVT